MSYLDPKILLAIKDLPLAARTTVDGLLAGLHPSYVKGPGMEFSQYRSYQPGDDLRSLDWKMFARSDRYYIRESEVETSISVKLLVDASGSMNHRDSGFTKLEYACYIAASLGYLAHRQGDGVGLVAFKENELFQLPSRRDHQHLTRFYYQLEQLKAGGRFTNPGDYREIFGAGQHRELLIFITDMYQQQTELVQLLQLLSALRHEMMVFHIMGRNEMTMDYQGFSALRDMETGQLVRIDAADTKKRYQQQLEQYLADVRTQMLDLNIVYRQLCMDEPLDQALRDFLNQRTKINH